MRAINVKGAGKMFTRTVIEQLTQFAVAQRREGHGVDALQGGRRDQLHPAQVLSQRTPGKRWSRPWTRRPATFILFCADELETVRKVLSAVRVRCGELMDLIDRHAFQFALVTDFPMFEYKKDEKRFAAMHHPFTMPFKEDFGLMLDDDTKAQVRSQAYDVVLNGVELGSGSVRIHRPDIQSMVFDALGFSKEEAKERFGFMMGAFRYGTPPHAGFAFGIDRLVMLLTGVKLHPRGDRLPQNQGRKLPDDGRAGLRGSQAAGRAEDWRQRRGGAARGAYTRQMTSETVQNTAMLSMLSLSASDEQAMDKDFLGHRGVRGRTGDAGEKGAAAKPYDPTRKSVNVRPDMAGESFTVAEVLMNAKTTLGNCITVPKTFE